MSTALRIAAVTQVLKDLLNDGLINNDVSGITQNNITVSSLPPDRIITEGANESSQLNIFMYQATYNQGWRNLAYPSFNTNGERITNPPLAIDLHYLLTAYGASELHTDILLGMGMHFFHETPVLGREQIEAATGSVQVGNGANNLPDTLRFLSQALLADQIEQIKITPEALSIEDISKLWAAFGTKYRPTAAYLITVVLIESEKSIKQGLPVKERNIYVQPFKTPVIEKILSQSALNQPIQENQKILNGYRLIATGTELMNEIVEVNIDGESLDAGAINQTATNTEIAFSLPNQLSAGMHELKVVHPVLMGTPPLAHQGASSKSVLFMITPAIQGNPSLSDSSVAVNGSVSGKLQVSLIPMVQPEQRVQVVLNEITNDNNPRIYTFPISASVFGNSENAVSAISFDISGVKSATYLVRVKVDSAESPLESDGNQKYISPFIVI
ncbi:MAG TPA: DUF4255 domain-containing protein [Niabella sp.]|nr:DUF4255 domain-containing protein [Niabella sp.]HOZ97728.1 DUF4255 domain-containing protein [Niabella sp.]HQW14043.1 DUF4255 domain-containing protein [Niabella sp.]HQX19414.1 DUF4255 domain-containing protein [Niabella sp.]HQX40233.1 DUF4255 domain-containing protein [Niabella sp.]